MKWMSSDGHWIVELIQLTATGTGRDGAWLRVTHRGIYIGEARDWDGVAPRSRYRGSPRDLS